MNENKIKTGTFKYVNLLQTGEPCLVEMTVDGVKYSVPLKTDNADYAVIQRLADAKIITIADAD